MTALRSGFVRAFACSAAVIALAGCTERRTAERADSDLSHDLALAGQLTAQPALKDTAIAPAAAPAPQRAASTPPSPARVTQPRQPASRRESRPAPAITAPPVTAAASDSAIDSSAAMTAAPDPRVIGAGTGIALSSGMRVCSNTNKVGDKLVATVTSSVGGTGGAEIPAGSRVVLEVARVTPGDAQTDTSIVFRPTAVYVNGMSYPVSGTVTSTTAMQRADAPSTGPSDKEKVVGGAVVGAILGQVFGHSTKSTVIGAAAGAATGAAVAHAQKSYQICLPEGASLVLTLNTPLTMN